MSRDASDTSIRSIAMGRIEERTTTMNSRIVTFLSVILIALLTACGSPAAPATGTPSAPAATATSPDAPPPSTAAAPTNTPAPTNTLMPTQTATVAPTNTLAPTHTLTPLPTYTPPAPSTPTSAPISTSTSTATPQRATAIPPTPAAPPTSPAPAKAQYPTATLTGRVLGRNGEPRVGERVYLQVIGGDPEVEAITVYTGNDGRFVISNAPAGDDYMLMLLVGPAGKEVLANFTNEMPTSLAPGQTFDVGDVNVPL